MRADYRGGKRLRACEMDEDGGSGAGDPWTRPRAPVVVRSGHLVHLAADARYSRDGPAIGGYGDGAY